MLSTKTALEILKTSSALKMLRTKTALGIDISDKRISLVLLKGGKNGVKLLASDSAPVPDGAIKNGNIENSRVLAKVIRELKTRNKIRSHPTALSLVANPVLIQILNLPKNIPSNIRQFVRNEVKHCAKLPIKNVAVDFCGIKSSAKLGNNRALVVATDNQKITEVAKTLTREGVNIDAVEPALVAYLRACYKKKIAQKPVPSEVEGFDRNLLFAIVCDEILTLCLFRNQTLDFVRTKRLEADKCDPAQYSKWLAGEIYEVLRFYELEVLDKRDKWEVILTADIDNEYIKDNIKVWGADFEGVELEVRTPEDAYLDTPVADTNLPDKPSAFAVGLAMKLLNLPGCSLNINLLPPEITEIKSERKQTLIIANIAAVILFLMILSVGFFHISVGKINKNINQQQQKRLQYNTKELLNEQILLNEQVANVSEKLNSMNAVLRACSFLRWGQILDGLRLAIPKKVRITDLSSGDNSKMLLHGQALSYEAVYLFVDRLNNCKHIESASLIETQKDNKSRGLVRYSISCSLIQ